MNNWKIEHIKTLVELTLQQKQIPSEWLMNRWMRQSGVSNGSFHLYYHLFYRIAQKLQPGLTVELGGWRGLAAAHFAAGHPLGKVVTIDHHGDPGDDQHQAEMLKVCNVYPNVKYIQGWTWDVIDQVDALNKSIDILFIDGWHMYDKAMRDWEVYSPMLSNNALIICDDLLKTESGAAIAGMWRFWEEISNGYESFVSDPTTKLHEGYPMGFFKYGH